MESKEHKKGGGDNEGMEVRALVSEELEEEEASPREQHMNDVFLSEELPVSSLLSPQRLTSFIKTSSFPDNESHFFVFFVYTFTFPRAPRQAPSCM